MAICAQILIDDFVGDCVGMEGGHCPSRLLNKIPFVLLRTISDKADDSGHIIFEEFEKKIATNSAGG